MLCPLIGQERKLLWAPRGPSCLFLQGREYRSAAMSCSLRSLPVTPSPPRSQVGPCSSCRHAALFGGGGTLPKSQAQDALANLPLVRGSPPHPQRLRKRKKGRFEPGSFLLRLHPGALLRTPVPLPGQPLGSAIASKAAMFQLLANMSSWSRHISELIPHRAKLLLSGENRGLRAQASDRPGWRSWLQGGNPKQISSRVHSSLCPCGS